MDDWVFTLKVSAETEYDGDISGGLAQIRQSHSAPSLSDRLDGQSAVDADDEHDALLQASDTGALDKNKTGWTFTSPFWSFSSQILLQATFRPAWQALSEYTRSSCGHCASSKRCCSCCKPKLDFHSTCWTAQDVQRITRVDSVHIEGVGDCRGLRVELIALDRTSVPQTVPPNLQKSWQTMVDRVHARYREVGGAASGATVNSPSRTDDGDPQGPVITFCLPAKPTRNDPPLLWKVEFPTTDTPLAIDTLTVLDGKLVTATAAQETVEPSHVYIHGYQSWSFAGSIVKGEDQPQSAMPDMFSKAFLNGATPRPSQVDTIVPTVEGGGLFEPDPSGPCKYHSDFFTCITSGATTDTRLSLQNLRAPERQFPYLQLDETGGPALVMGWLGQRQQFGRIECCQDLSHYQMHATMGGQLMLPGHTVNTDWACIQLSGPHSYDEEPLQSFLEVVSTHNDSRPLRNGSLLTGWCSWYHYYEHIAADSLRENFAKLATWRNKVPTNVSVVDDGYMTAWGDWDSLKPGKFPDGLEGVARDIESAGMRPGLWLAPYAADKHSQLAKDHPDWIIRNDEGVIANSSNCGKFFYGLDATNPQVRAHVHQAIHRAVHEWGYNVLKIDFLYAACLEGNGKYDLSISRAQAMHMALQTIRDAAGPDVFLIGCGCPIGSGIGYADGMRISADTGPTWYPALPLPWWDHGTLPCLRSMVRNSMTRAPLGHRFWHNDPDCLLLGASTRLTDEEVASAASIVAMTCGMMLLSDDLSKVSPTRMNILTKIFPMTGVSAVVLDLHNARDGLPSLLRLWCTDRYNLVESFRETDDGQDHNAEATYFGRMSSCVAMGGDDSNASDWRNRSCIHVAKGLGTWTVISISNWTDFAAVVHIPPHALQVPPASWWNRGDYSGKGDDTDKHGYHAFGFWSGKYTWLPNQATQKEEDASNHYLLSRKLAKHETEIYHIKPVTPDRAQYIGSDLHFSCGQEVRMFRSTDNLVTLSLNTTYQREGHVYVYIPRISTEALRVTVAGESRRWQTVGNTPNENENGHPRLVGRIVRIPVSIRGSNAPRGGQVRIEF